MIPPRRKLGYAPAPDSRADWNAEPGSDQEILNKPDVNGDQVQALIDAVALTWQVKSATCQAYIGQAIDVDTSAGAFTIYTPSGPKNDDIFRVRDYAGVWKIGGTLNLLVEGGSVGGEVTAFECDLKHAVFTFRYDELANDWVVSIG